MIVMLEPLSVGNAIRVILDPPCGSVYWTILRNTTGVFPSATDPASKIVYTGKNKAALDFCDLTNGTTYYYCPFYWSGSAWTPDTAMSAEPAVTYQDSSTDAMSVVLDRMRVGIANELAAKNLAANSGVIQVLSAPPVFQDTRFPVVTVHLLHEAPAERAIGELLIGDGPDLENPSLWDASNGWLARVQLAVIGWTQNPDERIALRKVLRRLMVANLPVFNASGMVEIEFTQQDVDAISGEYPANVYQSLGTFTCMAPVIIGDQQATFTDVTVTGTAIN